MYLLQDPNWQAVHYPQKTILKSDKIYYPQPVWEMLVNKVPVEPMQEPGHYRVLST